MTAERCWFVLIFSRGGNLLPLETCAVFHDDQEHALLWALAWMASQSDRDPESFEARIVDSCFLPTANTVGVVGFKDLVLSYTEQTGVYWVPDES